MKKRDMVLEMLEAYNREYAEVLRTMPSREFSEEYSFLSAIKDLVTDRYNDFQSIVSRSVDNMYELCHQEAMCRVINGSLEPHDILEEEK